MRVNVGDVILARYMDFEGQVETAMFVVAYHECYDVPISNNFTAIKISSKSYCYQIPLLKEYLTFLDHDSYLNCNMQFRFREEQVLRIVGRLTPYYLNKLLQQTNNYYEKMKKQITETIGEHNLFVDFSKPQRVEEEEEEEIRERSR